LSVALNFTPNPSVSIVDGVLLIDGFAEADPEVVRAIEAHDHPELAVHTCLQIGARAVHATKATVDTGIVEQPWPASWPAWTRPAPPICSRSWIAPIP
jgi:hypothetical protein